MIGLLLIAFVYADPSSYEALVPTLRAGETMVLAPGVYRGCLWLEDQHGEEGAPIEITGPWGLARVVFMASGCGAAVAQRDPQVNLRDVSWLELRWIELDGEGLFVDGVEAHRFSESVHHVTLEHLYLHDHGGDQQAIGISTKCTTWDWIIRDNLIERSGTGMYLGDSDGSDPFIRGTIERNTVVDPWGYCIQIKHQLPREPRPGMPLGDSVTRIADNVLVKEGNATSGANARPNLLVGHFPPWGPGLEDRYEITGNLLWENDGAFELFQGEGNLTFEHNLLIETRHGGGGVVIAPHNGFPRRVTAAHNTIVSVGPALVLEGLDARFPAVVGDNAIFEDGAVDEGLAWLGVPR